LGKRVLIVDDSYGDRLVLRDALVSIGYQVVGEAKNLQESLEKYESIKPDIVIMDAAIPDDDGVSAVKKLLRLDLNANILMCVSRGQRALAMEALQVGAKDFITKPINVRQLMRVLNQLRQ
jgi:two-component system chemotaxis response regulator CheY